MEANPLQVRMLGEFSLRSGPHEITDSNNRTHKVWLALAYMIYYRDRAIPQAELFGLLWGEDAHRSADPHNALKTMLHRVRTRLDHLGDSAGHTLIVRRSGNYAWNTDIPVFVDVDRFEASCRAGTEAPDEELRLRHYLEALELYDGDFLEKLSSEAWVIPLAAYYHNLYIQTLLGVLPLLESRGRAEEAVSLCRKAVVIEPYNETIYQALMRNLLTLGACHEVIEVYEKMFRLLSDTFSVMPSEASRVLYRQAKQTVNDHTVSIRTVLEQLQEENGPSGALLCDYDFFRIIYQAMARAVSRSGDMAHIALISVNGARGEQLPKRSLDTCMDNLQDLIRINLRRGDVAARCSVSQFVLLLPQANYENSRMVCERVLRAFAKQYPHSPARLEYDVQPLKPAP